MTNNTDFNIIHCTWLEKQGDDPETFARDGFCNACGSTTHKVIS